MQLAGRQLKSKRGNDSQGAIDSDLPPPPDINYEFDIEHDTAFLDESGEHSQADNSSVADNQQHSIQAESFDYYLNPTLNDKPSPPPQQHHLSGSANGIVNENTKLKTENNAYARRVGDLENQNDRIRTVVTQMRTEMERLQQGATNKGGYNGSVRPPHQAKVSDEYEELLMQKEALEERLHYAHAPETLVAPPRRPTMASTTVPKLFRGLQNVHVPTSSRAVESENEALLLRQQVHELEMALARTRGELLAARSECQEYESRMSAIDSELVTCKFALRQKQTHLQNAHRQLAFVQNQSDSYYRDLIESREIAKVYENQVYNLQTDLALAQSESRRVISPRYSEKRREDLVEIGRLKEENKLLRSKVQEAAWDLQRLMQEKEKLMDISNMLRADLARAKEDYEAFATKEQSTQIEPSLIEHYENRLAEMEILIHKLELQNKMLKKGLHEHRLNAANALDAKTAEKPEEKLRIQAVGHHVGALPREGPIHTSEKITQSQKSVADKQGARKAKLLEQRTALGLQIKNRKGGS